MRRGYVLDARLLERATSLTLIQRAGTNVSNIDIKAAAARGIHVATLPMHIDIAVAEHALTLMLGLARRVTEADEAVRSGAYRKLGLRPLKTDENTIVTNWMGYTSIPTLFGRTLGIIGFGEIGQMLAARATGLGMHVLYYQRSKLAAESSAAARYADLEKLITESDFISLHVPLTADTYRLVDDDFLRKMQPTAFLVNVSRGPVVDEAALRKALVAGRIAGAGLDVFSTEPLSAESDLLTAPNLLLSPHTASGTDISLDLAALLENVAQGMLGDR